MLPLNANRLTNFANRLTLPQLRIRSTERLVVVIIRYNFTQLRKEELIEKLA